MALASLVVASGAASAQVVEEPPSPPRMLVYSGTQSFHHGSIDHGNPILAQLAAETGAFTVEFTNDPAAINIGNLARFDLVAWNSPSGESFDGLGIQPAQACRHDALDGYACTSAPFTQEQRDQFIAWSECGGGFVGIHQALDAWHDWPEWDELTSFIFLSHFAAGEAEVFVEANDPIVAPFGAAGSMFRLNEEYYTTLPGDGPEDSPQFRKLLGIGRFTNQFTEASQGAMYPDHGPLAWTSSFRNKNRVFITNLGHSNATWDIPAFRQHLLAGIANVAEVRPEPTCVAAVGGPGQPPAPLPPYQGVVFSPPLSAQDDAVPGFLPQELTLPRGSTLEYVSVDVPIDAAHLLVSDTPGLFRSDGITTGRSEVRGVKDLSPGRYPYRCQVHPAMSGTLIIS
jgi:hypothetical protein